MKDYPKPYFQDLGVGVGLRAPFFSQFLRKIPKPVSWVEVVTENYLPWNDGNHLYPKSRLEKIRQEVPIVLHGVSLSLGSADPIDKNYLKRLKALVDELQPAIVSDHLCWTSFRGKNYFDLYPLPYTREVARHVIQKIQEVQEFLGRRILVENLSSYLEFKDSEMTEWEFLAEVLRGADCGLLLDVNNVYVSACNHHFDPHEYISALPAAQIGQIHLAGHSVLKNFLIDTHDAPVCAQVWDLYRWTLEQIGMRSTMLERDGNIPDWATLALELREIEAIRNEKISPRTNSKALYRPYSKAPAPRR